MAKESYSAVIGDVNGRFAEVFGKLQSLHSKQNFAFAIIAGNLFADQATATEEETAQLQSLLAGEIVVPLPTYFTLGNRKLDSTVEQRLTENSGELCANLSILGRKVSIKTSEGFRIVAIGGAHVDGVAPTTTEYEPIYDDNDSASVAKGLVDADILVTNDWPANVTTGSKLHPSGSLPSGEQSISDLCTALTPRYHFSASESFYEREPFFHNGPSPRPVTRFVSLAPFGNTSKQKWIYAFSLAPSAPPPDKLPEACTASPLTFRKRKLESQADSFSNYRYSNGNGNGNSHQDRGHGRNKRARNNPPPRPDTCYFCFSNSSFETHMLGSIGTDVYLTPAKGPLTTNDTFPSLGFHGHMLIIPLEHTATLSSISNPDTQSSTSTEMTRYHDALQKMITTKSRDTSDHSALGSVTWAISRAGGVHLHWQFLPIPVDLIQRGLVEAAFDVEAENLSYPKFAKDTSEVAEAEQGDFFKVTIWSEAMRKEIVLPLDAGFRFDLQFGRRVMAKLLGLQARVNWRDCAQSKAEEEADTEAFKKGFEEFDFSLE